MTKDRVIIFDTTLRDGEQAPGATMNLEEKLLIAKLLEQMNVDIIEAGFAAASPGDFKAVNKIATEIKDSAICSLARAIKSDIEKAGQSVKPNDKGRIHTFISTSDIHIKYQMRKTKDDVIAAIKESVSLARNLCGDVEWSGMDATRSNKDFLFKAIETAIAAGAKTVNIPDTVGYITPWEFHNLISDIKNNVPNIDKAIISVHCHNDLGLAVSNSLASIDAGARQIECAINGIGERAGNTALEEVIMALKTRSDFYKIDSQINTKLISRISKLVSNITGFPVQYNKAIVGANAFAHESGIHQDGMLKNRNTYEIMTPESIGLEKSSLILGKHSGRAAFKDKIKELGYDLEDNILQDSFVKFKELGDHKKEILDEDIISLIDGSLINDRSKYELLELNVNCGTFGEKKVDLKIKIDNIEKDVTFSSKDGPVDAIFGAIKKLISHNAHLELYQVNSVTQGTDSQATTIVRLNDNGKIYSGTGSDFDVLVASATAYINALEKLKNV
ncbi:2-isopropylmalate synthase [Rickettsiales bacterium]|nr:2-isopropylmalate synthase [Rickettsiales bacterium]MDB2550254.1 2-isopropylmalate synthase [Rickettsiales bacterium]